MGRIFHENKSAVFLCLSSRSKYFAGFLSWACLSIGQAQRIRDYARLATDVNLSPSTASLSGLTVFNNELYFRANDGTSATRVTDLSPGSASSLRLPMSAFNHTCCFQANNGLHGTELWRLDPLANVFRITRIAPEGSDVSLSWIGPGGWTNVVQTADDLSGLGTFSNSSPALVAPEGEIVTNNYLDAGGAINHPARYYRICLGP